jgi:hypothetical protein
LILGTVYIDIQDVAADCFGSFNYSWLLLSVYSVAGYLDSPVLLGCCICQTSFFEDVIE